MKKRPGPPKGSRNAMKGKTPATCVLSIRMERPPYALCKKTAKAAKIPFSEWARKVLVGCATFSEEHNARVDAGLATRKMT
jgi:hypothetical protein